MGQKHLQVSTIQFDLNYSGKKPERVIFKVAHNMPEVSGLSLEDALDNWLVRTKKYTAESFSAYVTGKGVHICEPYDPARHGNIIE